MFQEQQYTRLLLHKLFPSVESKTVSPGGLPGCDPLAVDIKTPF